MKLHSLWNKGCPKQLLQQIHCCPASQILLILYHVLHCAECHPPCCDSFCFHYCADLIVVITEFPTCFHCHVLLLLPSFFGVPFVFLGFQYSHDGCRLQPPRPGACDQLFQLCQPGGFGKPSCGTPSDPLHASHHSNCHTAGRTAKE